MCASPAVGQDFSGLTSFGRSHRMFYWRMKQSLKSLMTRYSMAKVTSRDYMTLQSISGALA